MVLTKYTRSFVVREGEKKKKKSRNAWDLKGEKGLS